MSNFFMDRYLDRPDLFSAEVLYRYLTDAQLEIIMSCYQNSRVAVKAGHKTGKSTLACVLALHWSFFHSKARTIVTAPTFHQIKNIIWRELRMIYDNAAIPLGGSLALDPKTGFKLANGREIIGISTTDPEAMAGISGPNNLYIVDEASGYDEDFFDVIEGNLAAGGKLLLISNPTRTSGSFYNSFTDNKSPYKTFTMASNQTPNYLEKRIIIPGMASYDWVEQKKAQWGEESPSFAVRVLGQFPTQGSTSVINLKTVESAVNRTVELEGDLVIGVDVARFGEDDSVLAAVRGNKLISIENYNGLDGFQLAGRVLELANELKQPRETVKVAIDIIGVGASVFDALEIQQVEFIEVLAVNVASKSDVIDENMPFGVYPDLRSQLWFQLGDWLTTAEIPNDHGLRTELIAPQYHFDEKGRYRVESKKDLKKRLKRSPDKADALALAVYAQKTDNLLDILGSF